MFRPTAHLISVGTSLKGNLIQAAPPCLGTSTVTVRKYFEGDGHSRGLETEAGNDPSAPYEPCRPDCTVSFREVLALLLRLRPAEQLAYRQTPTSTRRDLLPAEISYLLLQAIKAGRLRWNGDDLGLRETPGDPEPVTLLATDTPLGRVCAALIRELIKRDAWGILCRLYRVADCAKQELEVVVGKLTVDSADDFQRVGIPNLQKTIGEWTDSFRGTHQLQINLTGGFKGVVPYLAISGMFEPDATLAYLFENTEEILELPRYPLGVNYATWHAEHGLVELQEAVEDAGLATAVPVDFSAEMHSVARGGALAERMQADYQDQRRRGHLSAFAVRCIERLCNLAAVQDDQRAKLAEFAEAFSDHVWTGDRVPQMVEHAQRHHLHLLEYAEALLTPILKVAPGWLKSEQMSVLLGGLLLHDCGHRLDCVEVCGQGRRLFPEEIRELHHWLSWHRLTAADPADLGLEKFSSEWREAVALLSLYHRKSMPLDARMGSWLNPLSGKEEPCLEGRDWTGAQLSVEDLLKPAALLRLLDGLDAASSERAGLAGYHHVNLANLQADAASYRQQYEQVRGALGPLLGSARNGSLLARIAAFDQCCSERPKDALSAKRWPLRREIWKRLPALSGDERVAAALWQEAEGYRDAALFARLQQGHFLKHRFVQSVRVKPVQGFDKAALSFRVEITWNQQEYDAAAKKIELKPQQDWQKAILQEIAAEYETVRHLCQNWGLEVTYEWV